MKKKLLALLLAFVSAFGCASMTACNLFETTSDSNESQTQPDGSGGGNTDGKPSTDNNGQTSDSKDETHVHTYGDWKITATPTDTVNGVAAKTCEKGDDIQTVTLPKLTDSGYTKSKDTATCSAGGKVNYSITVDGNTFSFAVATPATGKHNYVNGKCACGAKDPDYTPSHTCVFKSTYDSTGHYEICECGQKKNFVPHSYTYKSENGQHWQVCSFGETTAKVAHNYVNGTCECGEKKNVIELEYKLNDDGKGYSVIGIGTVTDTHIVIPDTHNGKPVTQIAKYAFEWNQEIVSVEIADGVELETVNAGNQFAFCSKLKSVKLPSDLEIIPQRTFYGCDALADIEIPETVKHIGLYAFANCISLTEITVSKDIYIAPFAFFCCMNLKSFTVKGWDYHTQLIVHPAKPDFLANQDRFVDENIVFDVQAHFEAGYEKPEERFAMIMGNSWLAVKNGYIDIFMFNYRVDPDGDIQTCEIKVKDDGWLYATVNGEECPFYLSFAIGEWDGIY